MVQGAIGVALGAVALGLAYWRWVTPRDPGTAAAWRLAGAEYDERSEAPVESADRKIRQSLMVGFCGLLLIGSGVVRIVSEL